MNDAEKSWNMANYAIKGTWTEINDKIYLNFKNPDEDKWNSGLCKGLKVLRKVDGETAQWDQIRPNDP